MKTLLVIDDDESILSIFTMVLQHKGYTVIPAPSGEAGLELARQRHPDLILTDMNMPGTSGLEVLKCVKADPELAAIPVVLITGDEEITSANKEGESLADGILVKPVSLDALVRCVEEKLSKL